MYGFEPICLGVAVRRLPLHLLAFVISECVCVCVCVCVYLCMQTSSLGPDTPWVAEMLYESMTPPF